MQYLQIGEFYGQTSQIIDLGGIILTDTQYTHDKVDWHYHENAYFTFILQGKLLEGNKKEINYCSPGSLLFHNSQEPHYNSKPPGYTRGFQVELDRSWFKTFLHDMDVLQGSQPISNPGMKFLFYKIFKETKARDDLSLISIQTLLLEALDQLLPNNDLGRLGQPLWVNKVKELLNDELCAHHSLEKLAETLGIHPVHLSRYFPKYFQCGLGTYIRKLRVEKSLAQLSIRRLSLTEIAYECGFADQSHFNRCFKESMGINPFVYKKLLQS